MTGDSDQDQPRTRDDLVRLIAGVLWARLLSINDAMAMALADAVLCRFRDADLTIHRKRRPERRRAKR